MVVVKQTVNLLVCVANADALRQVSKPMQADINSVRTIDVSTCPSQERPMVDKGTFFKLAIQISHSKYFTHKDDITSSACLSFPIKFSSNFTAMFE